MGASRALVSVVGLVGAMSRELKSDTPGQILNAADVPTFDSEVVDGHFFCRIDIPADLPPQWIKPPAFIIAAVNHKFTSAAYRHYFCHKQFVMFITSDERTCNEIREHATKTLNRMKEPFTRTFKLRISGIGALHRGHLLLLLAKLGGEVTKLNFLDSFSEHYGQAASVDLKHKRDWDIQDGAILQFHIHGETFSATITRSDRFTNKAWRSTNGQKDRKAPQAGDDEKSGRPHVVRQRQGQPDPCRDNIRGRCKRGDACIFSHARATTGVGGQGVGSASSSASSGSGSAGNSLSGSAGSSTSNSSLSSSSSSSTFVATAGVGGQGADTASSSAGSVSCSAGSSVSNASSSVSLSSSVRPSSSNIGNSVAAAAPSNVVSEGAARGDRSHSEATQGGGGARKLVVQKSVENKTRPKPAGQTATRAGPRPHQQQQRQRKQQQYQKKQQPLAANLGASNRASASAEKITTAAASDAPANKVVSEAAVVVSDAMDGGWTTTSHRRRGPKRRRSQQVSPGPGTTMDTEETVEHRDSPPSRSQSSSRSRSSSRSCSSSRSRSRSCSRERHSPTAAPTPPDGRQQA